MKHKLLVYINDSYANDIAVPSGCGNIFTRFVRSARNVIGVNSIELLSFNNNKISFRAILDEDTNTYYYVPLSDHNSYRSWISYA